MVRAAREAVGVSRRQAGKVFGGLPAAFYKYETAKAVPSKGMANLLRLALERPDFFTKPAPGSVAWPSAKDTLLVRRAITGDRLRAIVRRIDPQPDSPRFSTPQSLIIPARAVVPEEPMTVAEQVYEKTKLLPQPLAQKALDFVLFLRTRQDRAALRDLMDAQSKTLAAIWDNEEDEAWNSV